MTPEPDFPADAPDAPMPEDARFAPSQEPPPAPKAPLLPTIGRIVRFHGIRSNGKRVHPAIVTSVDPDTKLVNLTVFPDHAPIMLVSAVQYGVYGSGEPDDSRPAPPEGLGRWWCWPQDDADLVDKPQSV